jgi:putative aminopeptidase FrvX
MKPPYRYCRAAAVLATAVFLAHGQTVPEAWSYAPVNQATVEARLAQYAGGNQRREQTLMKLFSEAGCEGQQLSEQEVKGARQPNVICVLPGDSSRAVIVGAHFDRVSEGDGVVDNWSGASLLPSLYQSLKSDPRHHTYIFIGFTDEEAGLVGSYFYVHHMSREAVALTDAMVNLDTLGLGPAHVWGSHSDQVLLERLAYVASRLGIPVSSVDVDDVGSTDSEEFASKNIPRITLHSLTRETWEAHILHTSKDTMARIRFADYYQTYRLAAAYLAALDQLPARSPDDSR